MPMPCPYCSFNTETGNFPGLDVAMGETCEFCGVEYCSQCMWEAEYYDHNGVAYCKDHVPGTILAAAEGDDIPDSRPGMRS